MSTPQSCICSLFSDILSFQIFSSSLVTHDVVVGLVSYPLWRFVDTCFLKYFTHTWHAWHTVCRKNTVATASGTHDTLPHYFLLHESCDTTSSDFRQSIIPTRHGSTPEWFELVATVYHNVGISSSRLDGTKAPLGFCFLHAPTRFSLLLSVIKQLAMNGLA